MHFAQLMDVDPLSTYDSSQIADKKRRIKTGSLDFRLTKASLTN